jgi:hypothetical protein
MLPSVFKLMRESNERIRSVWAAAGTATNKVRKQAVKKFFMGLVDYNPSGAWQEEESCPESKLAHRGGLVRPDASGNNFRAIVILATHWAAGHSSQHCQLARVRQRVCNWTLK